MIQCPICDHTLKDNPVYLQALEGAVQARKQEAIEYLLKDEELLASLRKAVQPKSNGNLLKTMTAGVLTGGFVIASCLVPSAPIAASLLATAGGISTDILSDAIKEYWETLWQKDPDSRFAMHQGLQSFIDALKGEKDSLWKQVEALEETLDETSELWREVKELESRKQDVVEYILRNEQLKEGFREATNTTSDSSSIKTMATAILTGGLFVIPFLVPPTSIALPFFAMASGISAGMLADSTKEVQETSWPQECYQQEDIAQRLRVDIERKLEVSDNSNSELDDILWNPTYGLEYENSKLWQQDSNNSELDDILWNLISKLADGNSKLWQQIDSLSQRIDSLDDQSELKAQVLELEERLKNLPKNYQSRPNKQVVIVEDTASQYGGLADRVNDEIGTDLGYTHTPYQPPVITTYTQQRSGY
ncbi:hypothetical protein N836_24440 [Leptolyngbya sp. Heron Island J]|uniref:hypothetical protein n=1 Tax=Leptolyngbya sp. Heron Island J TaxID=1385935 RepID=UPI0003B9C825|nr:hypothetical protein [Leptolyngbya sp. Heron Island J]ESA32763.1 hypothetical protein N836_24440 [Leptolyngbya sp. Heron Island J]